MLPVVRVCVLSDYNARKPLPYINGAVSHLLTQLSHLLSRVIICSFRFMYSLCVNIIVRRYCAFKVISPPFIIDIYLSLAG